MQRARPNVILEYKEKIEALLADHPLEGSVGDIADSTLMDLFNASTRIGDV